MVKSIKATQVYSLGSWAGWARKYFLKPSLERLFRIGPVTVWSISRGACINVLIVKGTDRPTKPSDIAGILYLSKCYRIKDCYRVGYLRIRPSYRGYGIAKRLYRKLVEEAGIVIMSGSEQTVKSQRLWRELCRGRKTRVHMFEGRKKLLTKASVVNGVIWGGDKCPYDMGADVTLVLSARKPRLS